MEFGSVDSSAQLETHVVTSFENPTVKTSTNSAAAQLWKNAKRKDAIWIADSYSVLVYCPIWFEDIWWYCIYLPWEKPTCLSPFYECLYMYDCL